MLLLLAAMAAATLAFASPTRSPIDVHVTAHDIAHIDVEMNVPALIVALGRRGTRVQLPGTPLTLAIVSALRHRDQGGGGQQIDIGLLDVQVAVLANQAMNYLTTGTVPKRTGNGHPNIAPYQSFPASDGHLILAIGNDGGLKLGTPLVAGANVKAVVVREMRGPKLNPDALDPPPLGVVRMLLICAPAVVAQTIVISATNVRRMLTPVGNALHTNCHMLRSWL